MIKKYLQDFFSYQFSHILGGRKYSEWAKNTLTLQKNIPIQNRKLAEELEDACTKTGFLTYSQFLTIDQFGDNGYHVTHKEHGMTDVRFRWPEALAALCRKKNLHHIVEFGPGNGQLGVRTIVEAKKIHHELFWSGVEINEKLREEAKKLFLKKNLEKQLVQLVSFLQELNLREKCLFVFSYSIDNLIPDVFLNTSQKIRYPNTMVGVTVKNGLLSEVILPTNSLKNGIYKDTLHFAWGMQSWQLHPMQRLYVPLDACRILLQTANSLSVGSQILIIDEFHTPSHTSTYHIGIPRDLQTFSRDYIDLKKFYKTAGSNLLYFPPYINTITSFLQQVGFSLEEKMGEHKMAYTLSGRNNPLPRHPRTLAILTSPKKETINKKKFILSAPVA